MALPGHHSHHPDERRLERERAEYCIGDEALVPSDVVRRTFLDRGFEPK